MLVQLPGQRMSSQILDANPLTYRQIAEPPGCLVVDPHMDEGVQGAVGGADTQGSVGGVGQLHCRVDDSMQRHIQVQIGTDPDDYSHQLFQLVAGCHQFVELFTHLAHRLIPPASSRLTRDLPVNSTRWPRPNSWKASTQFCSTAAVFFASRKQRARDGRLPADPARGTRTDDHPASSHPAQPLRSNQR